MLYLFSNYKCTASDKPNFDINKTSDLVLLLK